MSFTMFVTWVLAGVVAGVLAGLAMKRGGYAHPRARRELGQPMEGFEMRLGEERDDRDAPAAQQPLHLREMAKARDRGSPTTGLLLAGDRRQVAEEHLVDANREVSFELPGKEVELRRAAFHEEDLNGPLDGRRPNAGHAQHGNRQVVGSHPEGRRSYHRIL